MSPQIQLSGPLKWNSFASEGLPNRVKQSLSFDTVGNVWQISVLTFWDLSNSIVSLRNDII